jgi:hypothetical protein
VSEIEFLTSEMPHEEAMAHSTELLCLQSWLNYQAVTQATHRPLVERSRRGKLIRTACLTTHQAEHMRQLEAGVHARAELSASCKCHTAIEVFCEENGTLKRQAASADELPDTVVRLEAEVDAAGAERGAWCYRPTPHSNLFTFLSRISWVHLGRGTQCPRLPPPPPSRSLRACQHHVWNTHKFLKDRTAPHQREAELTDTQACKVAARATADALLQAIRTVKDHAARAERTITFAEREVGFLKVLNVRSPFALYLSGGSSIRNVDSPVTNRRAKETSQGPGYIDQAKEQHIISRISKVL